MTHLLPLAPHCPSLARTLVRSLVLAPSLALSLFASGLPASADGLTNGNLARIEVLDGGPLRQGDHQAALHLRLADGWKTYWRAPGDAGIPPLFDWQGSRNVGNVEIVWPTPIVFDQNGMRSIGYKDELVLPLRITPSRAGQEIHLSGRIEFGICKDVCIPAELNFAADLDKTSGRDPRIAAAMAQAPFSQSEAGVTKASCELSPVAGGLRVVARVAMPPIDGREAVVFEPNDPSLWSSESATHWDSGTLVADADLMHPEGGMIAIDRSAMTITVIGSGKSVEIHGCSAG